MLGAMPEIHAAVAARGIGPSGEVYEEMPFVVVVQFVSRAVLCAPVTLLPCRQEGICIKPLSIQQHYFRFKP